MPPKGHAILSASSSDRWLHCPPSARLCETYEDKGSDYAVEGTDAHELCEYKLLMYSGRCPLSITFSNSSILSCTDKRSSSPALWQDLVS